MKHKHDWQFAGRCGEIINKEEANESLRKYRRWLEKELNVFNILFFRSFPRPKLVYPEYEYYSKFACECGKTKMVKEK